MKSIKKNAVILTVLLFICAAVYLNWSYNKEVKEASEAGKKDGVSALSEDENKSGNKGGTAPQNTGENKSETTPPSGDENAAGTAATKPADALVNEGGAGLYYTVTGAGETGKTDGGEAGETSETRYDEVFADVRLERSQARDEAAATLSAVASADGASQETVDGALKAMTALADRAVKESEIESKIKSKGFLDCVVYLTDDRASVTVAIEGGLTQSSVAKITDIVMAETGLTADKLTVSEIK